MHCPECGYALQECYHKWFGKMVLWRNHFRCPREGTYWTIKLETFRKEPR